MNLTNFKLSGLFFAEIVTLFNMPSSVILRLTTLIFLSLGMHSSKMTLKPLCQTGLPPTKRQETMFLPSAMLSMLE